MNTPKECENCELRLTCGFGCLNCRIQTDGPEHPYKFHCEMAKTIVPHLFNQIRELSPNDLLKLSFQAKQLLMGGFYLPESIMERL